MITKKGKRVLGKSIKTAKAPAHALRMGKPQPESPKDAQAGQTKRFEKIHGKPPGKPKGEGVRAKAPRAKADAKKLWKPGTKKK